MMQEEEKKGDVLSSLRVKEVNQYYYEKKLGQFCRYDEREAMSVV